MKGAYARILDQASGKEFCKFNLSRNLDNISNGNIVATIARAGLNEWSIKALGYYTKNTWNIRDQIPIVNQLMKGDYSGVKILKDGEYGIIEGKSGGNNESCCNIF